MKLQELIENPPAPAAPPNPSMADKALGGAAKVAGAIDSVGKFASAVTGVKPGQSGKQVSLPGINTARLKDTLYKIVNNRELDQQDRELIDQTYRIL